MDWVRITSNSYSKGKIFIGSLAAGYAACCASPYEIKRVNGKSMQPTLNPQLSGQNSSSFWLFMDHVLIRSSNRYSLSPGDIVTFYNPSNPINRDIKRVRAIGNQVVTTRGYKNRTVVVPKGYLWVEGDNRAVSLDSNTYGPLPAGLIFGKAIAIVFPPSRWQSLKQDESGDNSKYLKASEKKGQSDESTGESDESTSDSESNDS